MRRITLDANVLAPGFTSQGSASARLINQWRAGAYELVLSAHVLRELARTLTDPYFARRLPADEATAILTLLSSNATVTELTVLRGLRQSRGALTGVDTAALLADLAEQRNQDPARR